MATIVDVAEIAKVSPTTVSRVLNNRGYISEKTKEKVYKAMDSLNYKPNEIARSLTKRQTNTLGIIVPHISHPYFSKLISNLENEAAKKKYKIILCNSKDKEEKEKEYLDMFKSNRVSGIISCSSTFNIDKSNIGNIPLVLIEKNFEESSICIQCDNYEGGRIATEHLIECGCRNILHFSGIIGEDMPADDREKAFIECCRKHNVGYLVKKCEPETYNEMNYREYIKNAILEMPEIDGIFASSDLIGAEVIQVCNELNISIPEDINLVGFDDVDIAQLTTPTITTIHQPVKEMAELAVSLIEKELNSEAFERKNILKVGLVKRNSTKGKQ